VGITGWQKTIKMVNHQEGQQVNLQRYQSLLTLGPDTMSPHGPNMNHHAA